MPAQILAMPGVKAPANPVGHFVRIGDSGHRQLSDLHAEGRFSPQRVVVDASRLRHQMELVEALRISGTRIVLDTKAAELAAPLKFAGLARGAPWAESGNGGPLGPDYFATASKQDVIGQIARFAVQHRMHTVLSPCHFLREGSKSAWLNIDRDSCVALRRELDRAGGQDISIDYELLVPHVSLGDVMERGVFLDAIKDLPFDNLWLRASGLGSDSGPLTTRRYINSLSAFHNIGKPIIADYLGGLIGLAATSFGVISGFAEGISERERFDAREWHNEPKARDDDEEFGRSTRVAISGFGRSVTKNELTQLHEAKGGRRLVSCGNRDCCLHGFASMMENPKRHGIYQRKLQIEEIEKTPNLNRPQHFLDGEMTRADRLARQIKDLNVEEKLKKRMVSYSHKVEKLRSALENLHETRGSEGPHVAALVDKKTSKRTSGAV